MLMKTGQASLYQFLIKLWSELNIGGCGKIVRNLRWAIRFSLQNRNNFVYSVQNAACE